MVDKKAVFKENAVVKGNMRMETNARVMNNMRVDNILRVDGVAKLNGNVKMPNISVLGNGAINNQNFEILVKTENGNINRATIAMLTASMYATKSCTEEPIQNPTWFNGVNIIIPAAVQVAGSSNMPLYDENTEYINSLDEDFTDSDSYLEIINEKSINTKLTIYPTPTQNKLNVVVENIPSGVIEIYDMQGKLCFSKLIDSNLMEINVLNWSNGIYSVFLKH